MATSLGMPLPPPRTDLPPWRTAWDTALYGPEGFYRRHAPAEHFSTALHDSDLIAVALVRLARAKGLERLVDVGAGRGELLAVVHGLAPELDLLAVEVAGRPAGLPDAVGWSTTLPDRIEGLVLGHEWLDNVPCHIVEVDPDGAPRVVHVDPASGQESLGHPVRAPGVPAALAQWLDVWWPVGDAPGTRAEVGTTRDLAWASVTGRLERGLAIAVDYGHTRETRPAAGSLRSYRDGRQVPVVPDGSRDVTAHVAVDAVAAACGGVVLRQREALRTLGLSTARPDLALAGKDPEAYVSALSRASTASRLTAPGGFGDFYWVVSGAGGVAPTLS